MLVVERNRNLIGNSDSDYTENLLVRADTGEDLILDFDREDTSMLVNKSLEMVALMGMVGLIEMALMKGTYSRKKHN